eukprot:scaffold243541_cov32-Tisochrysis_lutea.AAC.3
MRQRPEAFPMGGVALRLLGSRPPELAWSLDEVMRSLRLCSIGHLLVGRRGGVGGRERRGAARSP